MFTIIDYFAKRPLLLSAVACTLISVAGYYEPFILIPIIIALLLILTLILRLRLNPVLIVSIVLMIVVSLSVLCTNRKANTLKDGKAITAQSKFVVCDVKYKSETFCVAEAELIKSNVAKTGTKLTLYYNNDCLSIGDIATATLSIEKITDSDFRADSFSRGVYFSAKAKDIKILENESDFVLKCVQRVRDYIKNTLFENLGYSEASTLCALLFGETDYFTNDFYSAVKAAGVSHIMVVSGMHLAIIVTFFTKMSESFFYSRYVRAFIQFAVVVLMTALCGFTMSILRAGFTYILTAIAILIGRKSNPENTLGAALSLILITSPFAVFSVALQLSMLSTFGILSVAFPIIDYIRKSEKINSKLTFAAVSSLVVTLCATLLTLPVVINIFGWLSTVAIISNLAISYAVTLSVVLGFTALILNLFFPILSKAVFFVCDLVVKYINYVIKTLGSLDFSVVTVPRFYALLAIGLITLIFSALLACKKRRDMLKLKEMKAKIIREGGGALKWR